MDFCTNVVFHVHCSIKNHILNDNLIPIQGGGEVLGLRSPPGPVKSIDLGGFHAPTGAESPPLERHKFKPPLPGQIPEYSPVPSLEFSGT